MVKIAEFREIPISQITVGERLRAIDPAWAEGLAAMIADAGLLQPIEVVTIDEGYELVAGAHRLEAFKLLDRTEITARVLDGKWHQSAEIRLHQIVENIGRRELSALDRAAHLSELKEVYEILHPEAKRGGDRRSKRVKKDQTAKVAVWSFSRDAAEKTGLSERAIRLAVQIHTGIAASVRARIVGTWLADHQAGLKLLSEQEPEMQARVCDLLFVDPPKASNVPDALILAAGKRLPNASKKAYDSSITALSRLSQPQLGRAADYLIERLSSKELEKFIARHGLVKAGEAK